MTRKVAPDLIHRIEIDAVTCPIAEGMRAKRQLLALLELARAVDHLVCEDRSRAPGTIHCSWQEAIDKTRRALARLKRASGGGK